MTVQTSLANIGGTGHKQAIVVVWGQSVWWLRSALGIEQAILKFGEKFLDGYGAHWAQTSYFVRQGKIVVWRQCVLGTEQAFLKFREKFLGGHGGFSRYV